MLELSLWEVMARFATILVSRRPKVPPWPIPQPLRTPHPQIVVMEDFRVLALFSVRFIKFLEAKAERLGVARPVVFPYQKLIILA